MRYAATEGLQCNLPNTSSGYAYTSQALQETEVEMTSRRSDVRSRNHWLLLMNFKDPLASISLERGGDHLCATMLSIIRRELITAVEHLVFIGWISLEHS